jgi:hypothetical protein
MRVAIAVIMDMKVNILYCGATQMCQHKRRIKEIKIVTNKFLPLLSNIGLVIYFTAHDRWNWKRIARRQPDRSDNTVYLSSSGSHHYMLPSLPQLWWFREKFSQSRGDATNLLMKRSLFLFHLSWLENIMLTEVK